MIKYLCLRLPGQFEKEVEEYICLGTQMQVLPVMAEHAYPQAVNVHAKSNPRGVRCAEC
jgi:hypothetical protein